MKLRLGLDVWDVAIHVFVTFCAAFAVGELTGPGTNDIALPMVFGGSAILLGIRRRRALSRLPLEGTPADLVMDQLEELDQRVAELETLTQRVFELEERMDFTERVLTRPGHELTPDS
jgi:hypothetical protein